MMYEVLEFFLKALVIVGSVAAVFVVIALFATKASHKSELEVEPLHEKTKDTAQFLKSFSLSKEERKEEKKKRKAEQKQKEKAQKSHSSEPEKRVFVLSFEGDVNAHQVESLREEITAILQTATPKDEVVLKLESPGGVVHGYGLAASQLARIRDRGIPLTICVDKVAASGGYMMAVLGNRILAAPFAIVGSIGVLAQVPNFHRILKKLDVDYKEYTAGDYKRTISLLGEISPEGEKHFLGRLTDTHNLFKAHVSEYRPQLNVAQVANGDHWYGKEALSLGLVDEIKTSDDYLMSFPTDTPIFKVSYKIKESWNEKLSHILGKSLEKGLFQVWNKLERQKFF
ncbi:MAG: protease SohB [Proteobacteria bacterium]|nr:protease SohB [Pseudomonadota bacterium]